MSRIDFSWKQPMLRKVEVDWHAPRWSGTFSPVWEEDVEHLARCLREAGFWSSPGDVDLPGLHGAQWILEGVEAGRYRMISRWYRDDDPEQARVFACLRFRGILGEFAL